MYAWMCTHVMYQCPAVDHLGGGAWQLTRVIADRAWRVGPFLWCCSQRQDVSRALRWKLWVRVRGER